MVARFVFLLAVCFSSIAAIAVFRALKNLAEGKEFDNVDFVWAIIFIVSTCAWVAVGYEFTN